jgi:hypothetical protein
MDVAAFEILCKVSTRLILQTTSFITPHKQNYVRIFTRTSTTNPPIPVDKHHQSADSLMPARPINLFPRTSTTNPPIPVGQNDQSTYSRGPARPIHLFPWTNMTNPLIPMGQHDQSTYSRGPTWPTSRFPWARKTNPPIPVIMIQVRCNLWRPIVLKEHPETCSQRHVLN